jgi:hypothetical protein
MKTTKRFSLGIAALLFTLAACAELTEPGELAGEPIPQGMGQVHIQLDQPNARTAIPSLASPNDLYFTLVFTADGKATVERTLNKGTSLTVAMEPGDWKLEVKGYRDHTKGSLMVQGGETFSITAAFPYQTEIVVKLVPVFSSDPNVTGSLSYSVTFPKTVSRALLGLHPLDAPGTIPEIDILHNNGVAITKTNTETSAKWIEILPAGSYQVLLDLYDGTNNTTAVWTGVMHIYNSSTTFLDQAFKAANFAACPPVVEASGDTLAAKLEVALASLTGSYTIVLDGNETLEPQNLAATSGEKIAITIRGNGKTVQVKETGTPLFTLGAGLTLAIQDLTLKGKDSNTVPVVQVNSGGKLELKTGSVLTGNTSSNNGGGVYVASGGTLTMSGGEISGNTTTCSGDGTFGGGGVFINGGKFTLSGGKISGNESGIENQNSVGRAGGVYVNGGTFEMSGGEISDNTAFGSSANGGGVHVTNNGKFTMSGGTISRNIACGTSRGGGVYVTNQGTFTLRGGTIYGEEAGYNKNTAESGAAIYKTSGGLVEPFGLVTGEVRETTTP